MSVQRALDQCSFLLLILTQSARESRWVREEIAYAEAIGRDVLCMKYEEATLFGAVLNQKLADDRCYADYPEEVFAALIEEFKRRNVPRSE